MNRFVVPGEVRVTGSIDTKNQANAGAKFDVTVTRANGDVLTIVPLVAFGHAAEAITAADGQTVMVCGSVTGREYQGKNYLGAVADMVLPLAQAKREEPTGDKLEDIPF